MNCFEANISFVEGNTGKMCYGSGEAKVMHKYISPASNANKKKVGSNHCPPKRADATVDPCASLCKPKKNTF